MFAILAVFNQMYRAVSAQKDVFASAKTHADIEAIIRAENRS